MAKRSSVEVIPIPENGPICDFCASESVVWLYPTEQDLVWTIIKGDGATHRVSLPGFAACEECAALIEAGDREGLERRSLEAQPEEHRESPITPLFIHRIHGIFWDRRTGPRERYPRA